MKKKKEKKKAQACLKLDYVPDSGHFAGGAHSCLFDRPGLTMHSSQCEKSPPGQITRRSHQ